MPEQWTCAMAEEALMELSVGSLDEAPAPLRAHLAKCAQCTNRVARIRHAERVMHNDLGALRSRHRSDDLAWDVLAISRSERGLWRVPGALRIAGIAAGTSTITAVAAGLLLCLLHPPTTHSASAAPEPHRSTLVLASSSLVLVQDDRVVVVLSSQR
jgi:hypothetical protein